MRREQPSYLYHSLLLSLGLHLFLWILLQDQRDNPWKRLLAAMESQERGQRNILIELDGEEDEELERQSPFVSVKNRQGRGKLSEEKGIQVFGSKNFEMAIRLNPSRNIPPTPPEQIEPIEKEKEGIDQRRLPTPPKPLLKSQPPSPPFPPPNFEIIANDDLRVRFHVNEEEGLSPGSRQFLLADFYLKYVKRIIPPFKKFAWNAFLFKPESVDVLTRVDREGKIEFVRYEIKSDRQPSLNYISRRMVDYALPIENISDRIFPLGEDAIYIRIRLTYSGSGLWWLTFLN